MPQSRLGARAETKAKLEEINLKGVDDDARSALTLVAERARLVLYGSLAITGGAMTAAWTGDRSICAAPFQTALPFLTAAVWIGWSALGKVEELRNYRIVHKYKRLEQAEATFFAGETPPPPTLDPEGLSRAEKDELDASDRAQDLIAIGAACAALGSILLLIAALPSINDDTCYVYSFWPLTFLN